MKPISEVTACVVDLGIFIEVSRVLARTYKKVFYCNPSGVTQFTDPDQSMIGYGFPEIEVVHNVGEAINRGAELLIYLDTSHGQDQVAYAEKCGLHVWGSRLAERFELDRLKCKKKQEDLKLALGPYWVIHGITELRKFMENPKGKGKKYYLKISFTRGVFETFNFDARNPWLVSNVVDEIALKLGDYKDHQELIIEEDLENTIDLAFDAYNIDGQLPSKGALGSEDKGSAYLCRIVKYSDLAPALREYDIKMAPTFKHDKFRGFYSAESRCFKDGKVIMNDLAPRNGSPPAELLQELYKNLAEIIYKGAQGIVVDPVCEDKWGAELILFSMNAMDKKQAVHVPRSMSRYVKLRNCVRIDGHLWVLPQPSKTSNIGAAIGWGNSMEDALEMAKEVADSVEGYCIESTSGSLESAEKQVEKLKSYGFWPKG